MFKARLISTLILGPALVFSLLFLPLIGVQILATLIVLMAAWELAGLSGIRWIEYKLLFLALLFFILEQSFFWPTAWINRVILIAAVFWFFNLILLLSGRIQPHHQNQVRWFFLIQGGIALWCFWLAVLRLYIFTPSAYWLLYFLFLIWSADIGAYLVGKHWGKHRLSPSISPAKTIEGVLGALFAAGLISLGGSFYLPLSFDLIWLSLSSVLVSIGGDLWESWLKRSQGVKDSGGLIPGHGGLLDRIDSQIAAAPFFAAWLIYRGGL